MIFYLTEGARGKNVFILVYIKINFSKVIQYNCYQIRRCIFKAIACYCETTVVIGDNINRRR